MPPSARALLVLGCLMGCDARSEETGVSSAAPVRTVSAPDLRIGSVDDPEYAFNTVSDLLIGEDGTIYSLHFNEASVRVWTPNGEPSTRLGREGDGPGEFRRPSALGFFGDTLWVADSRTYAVSYFVDHGFVSKTTPEINLGERGQVVAPPRPDLPLRDGTFLARSPEFSHSVASGDLTAAPWTIQGPAGDHLLDLWTKPVSPNGTLALEFEGGQMFSIQPFADDLLTATGSDGFFVIDRSAWDGEGSPGMPVTKIAYTSDTLWSATIPYDPVALSGAEADAAMQEVVDRLFSFMSERGITRASLESDVGDAFYQPGFVPPAQAALVAADGALWIQRPEGGAGDGSTTEWWVVNGDGTRGASALLPTDLRVLSIQSDAVWGVIQDEFEVNYIVRLPFADAPSS